jgi:CMP-N,N'-diacetyllegionaminic acid synthase
LKKVLAVIPARGGSKGVPKKNIKNLANHPLIAWTIAAAREATLIDEIYVSTDDMETVQICGQYGLEVPFMRPENIAQDHSRDYDFLKHALDFFEAKEGGLPELVVLLRPTSPIRPKGLINQCITAIQNNHAADSLRTVIEAPHTPYKMWRPSQDGQNLLNPLLPPPAGINEPHNAPRQELPKVLLHVGVVDVMKTETILELESVSGPNILGFEIAAHWATDIDNIDDFHLAEIKLNKLMQEVSQPIKIGT